MNDSIVNSFKIGNARLQWQEDGRPYSIDYNDVYFSRGDEIAESSHVFFAANNLTERWNSRNNESSAFVIGELGFGCGLNFLNTWQRWQAFKREQQASDLRLHYIALEKHPLNKTDLERICKLWPVLGDLSAQLLTHYPDHSAGCHRLILQPDLILDLHYGDALDTLQQLGLQRNLRIDCWYADGFNPKTNPTLWQRQLFHSVAKLSSKQATLSSYSVAGEVRRALQDQGFQVEKAPGFGNKRHMLKASYPGETDSHSMQPGERSATVIGAGLAGSALAHSLAIRGWKVTVIEAQKTIAMGASGSGQLNLRCQLMASASPLARFYLHAYLFARHQFSTLSGHDRFWHPGSLIHLDSALKPGKPDAVPNYKERLTQLYDTNILTALNAEQLSEIAGIDVHQDGLHFPLGGWIDPNQLLSTYLSHENITLLCGSTVDVLEYDDNKWLCYTDNGELLHSAPVLALCAGAGIQHWSQTRELPLQALRGQTTQIAHPELASDLSAILCGTRTVFPASNGTQTVSASYHRYEQSTQHSPADDAENLQALNGELQGYNLDHTHRVGSTVGVRYNSIDHAPIIGEMPDLSRRPDSANKINYLPKLFISTAHSSSGLATCPFAGEYLASKINGDALPFDSDVVDSVAPERFLLRKLKRRG